MAAATWLLAAPAATGVASDEVRVSNPTGSPAALDVRGILPGGARLPVPGATALQLAPGATTTVALTAPERASVAGLALEVVASGPVVVQRERAGAVTDGRGATSAPLGVPAA
jgi:hypothetical protein